MRDARLVEKDRMARAFIDGAGNGPVCIGYMPLEVAVGTSAALWLTAEGVKAIKATEKKVICKRAGVELASDIAKARWRKENGCVIAETGFFAYAFTAARDGWHLTECQMLWTARVELQPYLRIFGDFRHSAARGILPDFYLRDLTAAEIKENELSDGAVLSVSSSVIKEMGRFHKAKKRGKKIRAILEEWSMRGGVVPGEKFGIKTKREKNALVISLTGKRG